MQCIRTECFSRLLDIHMPMYHKDLSKFRFALLSGANILVHSFPSYRHSISRPLINLRQSLSLSHLFFLHFLHSAPASFFLSSFSSPAAPLSCGEAVVDQTHSPAGGDIPFISSLFQMALLCISWQPVQLELFGGAATERISFPLL